MRQILNAVSYCHNNYVMHRDLKPSNILLDPNTNIVKVGDFGLAKQINLNPQENTTKISALFYRAPEILLGFKTYDFGIDLWSIGCILA